MGFSLKAMIQELLDILSSNQPDAAKLALLQKAVIDGALYAKECGQLR